MSIQENQAARRQARMCAASSQRDRTSHARADVSACRLVHRLNRESRYFSPGSLTRSKVFGHITSYNARCSFGEAVLGQSFGAGPCLFLKGGTV